MISAVCGRFLQVIRQQAPEIWEDSQKEESQIKDRRAGVIFVEHELGQFHENERECSSCKL